MTGAKGIKCRKTGKEHRLKFIFQNGEYKVYECEDCQERVQAGPRPW